MDMRRAAVTASFLGANRARRGEQPAVRPEAPPERGYALAGSSSAPGWMIPDS